MATTFKCCKNKDPSNYFCLICKNVFHKSCLNRGLKKFEVVNENLIWCSRKCIDMATENEEELLVVDDLRSIIRELQTEISDKNNHIARLKRSSVSFCEEATRTEQEYIKEIETLTQKNEDLRERLNKSLQIINKNVKSSIDAVTQTKSALKDKHSQTHDIIETPSKVVQIQQNEETNSNNDEKTALEIKIKEQSEDIQRLKDEIEESNSLSRNMISSIRVLEAENHSYSREIGWLKNKMEKLDVQQPYNDLVPCQTDLCEENSISARVSVPSDTIDSGKDLQSQPIRKVRDKVLTDHSKGKLLILTDDYGKNLYSFLNIAFKGTYSVQIICKPYAKFNEVVSDMDSLVTGFTKSDFVMVLAGVNNDDISSKIISSLADKCFFTNLILCTIPINFSFNYKENFYSVNNKIFDCISRLCFYSDHIKLLDLQDKFSYKCFYNNSIYLNPRGKRLLASILNKAIVNFFGFDSFKTLRRIETQMDSQFPPECIGEGALSTGSDVMVGRECSTSSNDSDVNIINSVNLSDSVDLMEVNSDEAVTSNEGSLDISDPNFQIMVPRLDLT